MKFITILTLFVILFVALIEIQGDGQKNLPTSCKHFCKHLHKGQTEIKRPDKCVCSDEAKTTVNAASKPTEIEHNILKILPPTFVSNNVKKMLDIEKQAKPRVKVESKLSKIEQETAIFPVLDFLDKQIMELTMIKKKLESIFGAKSTVKTTLKPSSLEELFKAVAEQSKKNNGAFFKFI